MHWRRRERISDALSRLGGPLSRSPLPPGVEIGRHTFGHHAEMFQIFMSGACIEVGAFCSFQREARILAGSEHVMTRASTFPFNARLFAPEKGNLDEAIDKGTTIVGNDVWIGLGAIILSGIMIGDGAVIGAGAVVSKSVPPYAIVAGNPAQVIRYRFDADVRRRLLALQWWDWDDEELREAREWFTKDVETFLDEMERTHDPRPVSELDRRLRALPAEKLTSHRDAASTEPAFDR